MDNKKIIQGQQLLLLPEKQVEEVFEEPTKNALTEYKETMEEMTEGFFPT